MPQTKKEAPNPFDIALGVRIRLLRRKLGLSQERLANEIGVTFQQVQKYEIGANRVSFSRLVSIAHALQCNVVDLFDGYGDANGAIEADTEILALLSKPGAVDLLESFKSIASPDQRRALVELTKQLAKEP